MDSAGAVSVRIIFLRHAETRVQSEIPSSEWVLSAEGCRSARRLVATGVFDDVDVIVASDERKALQSIDLLSKRLQLQPIEEPLFRELDRGVSNLSSSSEYSAVVKQVLMSTADSFHGWETACSALDRFRLGVQRIETDFTENTVLVASHGIVLSLYFADKLGMMDKVYERWSKLDFLDYGVVTDGVVTRDLAGYANL